jgi:hypothetical protein
VPTIPNSPPAGRHGALGIDGFFTDFPAIGFEARKDSAQKDLH